MTALRENSIQPYSRRREASWCSRVEHMVPWGMEGTFEEGRGLYEEGAVRHLQREEDGTYTALVYAGNEVHPVSLSFLPPPILSGSRHYLPTFLGDLSFLCLCGEERCICPHTVAVLLAIGSLPVSFSSRELASW